MSSSSESVQSQKNTRGHLDLVQGSLWNSLQLLEILWHLGHCCEQGWELAGELRPVQPRGADAPLVGQLFSASPREKNIQLCAQQCVGWGASWSPAHLAGVQLCQWYHSHQRAGSGPRERKMCEKQRMLQPLALAQKPLLMTVSLERRNAAPPF